MLDPRRSNTLLSGLSAQQFTFVREEAAAARFSVIQFPTESLC